jgi:general secretion pathway protein G
MKPHKKNKYNRGFTLIELLVVISIISILSSVVLASINTARVNARDAKRISDLRQIRIALELYRNTNGDYPVAGPWILSSDANWDTTSALQTALAPYLPKLPKDPINNTGTPWVDGGYTYAYGYAPGSYSYSTTKRYDLSAQLENQGSSYRCEIKRWQTGWDGTVWCESPNPPYSKYLYTGEY